MQYTYDENNNRIRKLQTGNDEYYILGATGETEAVFDANGKAKFYNVNNGGEIIGRMIPPINNLTLTNTTLVGNYKASNSITAETNVSVTGAAVLKAGNTINLKPGFTASSGCNLTISVGAVTSDKYYYLKDHLGSIRVVVDTVGEIVSYSDYDPWGMILNGRSSNYGFADDKYKFTGKERDSETGYFHFGARAYDGRIGRWNVIDPLFEKYPNVSPYNYSLNNPTRFIDTDGRVVADPTGVSEATVVVVGGLAIATALTIHTVSYVTNSSYRARYDSYTSSVAHLVSNSVNEIGNFIGNLFSSNESENSGGAQTKEQLESAKESHENRIKEHEQKLEEYQKNPEAHDNQGKLKNAKPEHKEKIIKGRVKVLKDTIKKHQKELEKVIEKLNKLND